MKAIRLSPLKNPTATLSPISYSDFNSDFLQFLSDLIFLHIIAQKNQPLKAEFFVLLFFLKIKLIKDIIDIF